MIFSYEIVITIHQKPSTWPSHPYPRPRFQWPKSCPGSKWVWRAPTPSHPWFASRLVHLSSTFKITIVRQTNPLCLPVHLLPQQREDEKTWNITLPSPQFTSCHCSDNTGRTSSRTGMPAPSADYFQQLQQLALAKISYPMQQTGWLLVPCPQSGPPFWW